MGIFGLILLCERVKGIINDCISRQFAAYKEVSNYNTWKILLKLLGQRKERVLQFYWTNTRCSFIGASKTHSCLDIEEVRSQKIQLRSIACLDSVTLTMAQNSCEKFKPC